MTREKSWVSDDTLIIDCSSEESSKNKVNAVANTEIAAHAIMTLSFPSQFAIGRNIIEPIRAPAFPDAAHIPFSVDRQGRENVMLGIMKVCVTTSKKQVVSDGDCYN